VISSIIFAAEQIIESEAESKDQELLTNKLDRIVADGTDDIVYEDQSEHAIEHKHFTNGNDGLRRNDCGRCYRPLSTLKLIQRSVPQNNPPTFHFTMYTDQMDSEETAAGCSN
ncbi:MAG: hypothetical protein EZS28_048533, partial [Streblomastix strix]